MGGGFFCADNENYKEVKISYTDSKYAKEYGTEYEWNGKALYVKSSFKSSNKLLKKLWIKFKKDWTLEWNTSGALMQTKYPPQFRCIGTFDSKFESKALPATGYKWLRFEKVNKDYKRVED